MTFTHNIIDYHIEMNYIFFYRLIEICARKYFEKIHFLRTTKLTFYINRNIDIFY